MTMWSAVQLNRCQEIDLFGEIGGCSFTPDGYAFFLCVADVVYSSLMEFTTSSVKRTSSQKVQQASIREPTP